MDNEVIVLFVCVSLMVIRFPILSNGINLNIAKVQRIVVATAVLHNTAIENNEDPPPLKQREEALFNQAIDVSVDLIANTNDGK
jgi:hypothetical protein